MILDVVYNHRRGQPPRPDARVQGVDNASYYRLMPDDPRHYMDFTGTGNSLNPMHPSVLRLIMDSLRYWVIDCHVDGFRFDLARPSLASSTTSTGSPRSSTRSTRTVVSQVKLIAEPWDVGPAATRSATSRCSGRSGTGSTATRCATSGAARRTWRLRHALHRLGRPLRVRRPPAGRLDQLRHGTRRLHAARPRLVQREAQRGERRGQPRRHRRQPLVEPRRRGADRRPRRSASCGCGRCATS